MLEDIFDAYQNPTDKFIASILKSAERIKPFRTGAFAEFCDQRAKAVDPERVRKAAKTWLPRQSRDVIWDSNQARNMLIKSPLHPIIAMGKLIEEVDFADIVSVQSKLHDKHIVKAIDELEKAKEPDLTMLLLAWKFNDIFSTLTAEIDFDCEWLAKRPGSTLPPNKILSIFPTLYDRWNTMTAVPYLFILDAVLTDEERKESQRIGGKTGRTFVGMKVAAWNKGVGKRQKMRDELELQLKQAQTDMSRSIGFNIR